MTRPPHSLRYLPACIILLTTLLFKTVPGNAMGPVKLDYREQAWLAENHLVQIRASNWPPFQFNDAEGIRGLSLDYISFILPSTIRASFPSRSGTPFSRST